MRSPEDREARKERRAERRAHADFTGGVYGSLLAASVVLGAGSLGNFPRVELVVLLVLTGVVFWLAHVHAKLFGERLGRCLAEANGLEVVAVRIGWARAGENRPEDVPLEREWFRMMWLSNRDFCQLMERCMLAYLDDPFVVVHGMSNNTGMRWDLDGTRALLGYQPQDDVNRVST